MKVVLKNLVTDFFFSIFILVPSVTANIEMTPPMIGLHMAGKISRCRGRLKDV